MVVFVRLGLAATLAQIQAGAKQQEAWILEYTKVADELEKEVMNIEEIHRALPPGCHKEDTELERLVGNSTNDEARKKCGEFYCVRRECGDVNPDALRQHLQQRRRKRRTL